MSNYLFVSPLQYEEEVSVHLQFVLQFIFYCAQCYCNSCCAVSMQFWSCSLRKIFVNVHELPIGQFLHIFLAVLDYFALLDLTRFCLSNVVRKEKNCHFAAFPHSLPPPLYVQEFQRSNRKQKSEEFGGLSWVRCGIWSESIMECSLQTYVYNAGIYYCSSQESILIILVILITQVHMYIHNQMQVKKIQRKIT